MKLRTKFAIIMLVGTLVLGSAVSGGLELYKQQTLEQSQDSVDESATLAAGQIESSLDERADYIGYLASRPTAVRLNDSSELIGGVVNNSRFFAAQVVDENGTVVSFGGQINESVRQSTIGSDVSDESYFRGAKRQSAYVSTPEYVPSRDRHLVVISAPILDDEGFVGVLAASIYVSTDTFLNPVTALDTQNQRVIVSADDATLYESSKSFPQATVGSATIDGYGWTVQVERDRRPLNSQLRTLAVAQGLGLLVVLVFVAGLWTWELKTNLRQTKRLLTGFAALQRGEHDHRVELTSGEEWDQISDGFNELAAGLAEREATIREREQRLNVLNRILRHNLRNDMNVIVGYAELIEERVTDDTLSRASSTIHAKGTHLVELSEKARWIDTGIGDGEPTPQPHDAVTIVEDVVSEVADDFPETAIRTTTPERASIYAVSGIRAALVNVVENACVHNDSDDPVVDVSLRRDGDQTQFVVADNGPGIPSHEYDVLEAEAETALQHGSSIGLWVVHWLVRQSGGRTQFTENDPRGAVVTLTFDSADGE